MGRELRMVPSDWQHPKDERGNDQPKFNRSFAVAMAEWQAEKDAWDRGEFPAWASEKDRKLSFEEWSGTAPDPDYYMPEFAPGTCTHFQMYENTSEGTPISPVFATIEELAHWLADTGASAFGSQTASYEAWLATCKRGWAPSAVGFACGLQSGVEGLASVESQQKNGESGR